MTTPATAGTVPEPRDLPATPPPTCGYCRHRLAALRVRILAAGEPTIPSGEATTRGELLAELEVCQECADPFVAPWRGTSSLDTRQQVRRLPPKVTP